MNLMQSRRKNKSEIEFVALMAFLMSNAALSIDAILPGLNSIGVTFNVVRDNNLQFVITMILVGLGIGQLIFGTLSKRECIGFKILQKGSLKFSNFRKDILL